MEWEKSPLSLSVFLSFSLFQLSLVMCLLGTVKLISLMRGGKMRCFAWTGEEGTFLAVFIIFYFLFFFIYFIFFILNVTVCFVFKGIF